MIVVSTFSIRLRGETATQQSLDMRMGGLTSSSYAGGQSEIMMGAAIKKYGWKRNDLVFSTKVLYSKAPRPQLQNSQLIATTA
jgi:hypothetical protein